MPITYQPPAPVGAMTAIARQQVGQGVPLSEMYAAEMQGKQQAAAQQANLMARDREFQTSTAEGQNQFAASRQFSPRDQGIAQAQESAQAQAMQQRVQAQMEMNRQELTQGEALHLQRLKQGEDQIRQQVNEKSITPEEGRQQLMQLRTPIQVYEARKAESQIKHQDMQNQQLQQAIETQRSVEIRKQKDDEERLAYSAAQLNGKLKQVVDPGMANELTAKYSREMPDMAPEAIQKGVEEELLAGGHYSTWYPDAKGVPTLAKDSPHGRTGVQNAGSSSGGEGASSKGGKGGVPEFDPSRAYHDAESAVDKLVVAGTVKPEDAQAEIDKRVNARKAFHASVVGEKQTAASAGKPAPFDPANLESGTDQQKGKVVALKDTLQTIHQRAADFTPMQTVMMSKAVNESIRLTAQYSDKDGRMDKAPPVVKHRIEQLKAVLAPLGSPAGGLGGGDQGGPMTMEQRQALAQKLQDRAGTGPGQPQEQNAPPAIQGQQWVPPHEVIEPGTGKRIMLPGRFVNPAVSTPQGQGENAAERGFRYFGQGLDRLRKSVSGHGKAISFEDY